VAIDSANNVYVALVGANMIEKFTPSGVGSIFADTGLDGPTGLAFDRAGNLFVTNQHGNYIEKYTPDGVGTHFAGPGPAPLGMAFDSTGDLFVAYYPTNTIERFSSSGTDLGVFANTGLSSPQFLAIQVVPEPSSIVLGAIGLLALAVVARPRRAKLN
jgi:sugar lactone lactonase YvrE